jgi:carbamoyl-phosphate synthase large subunit
LKEQKTIMIFGGGDNQLSLIKAAKALGVTSLVIDPDPNAVGREFCDHFEVVAPKDLAKTLEVARKYDIDGIVTGQMENPLRLMAEVAEMLNLIFPSKEVIERCRNKFLMKEAFLAHDIPCANGMLLKADASPDDLDISDMTFPLIMKPLDAFSSRGVLKISGKNEILDHLDETRSFSSSGDILLEEFIDGKEYSIETITYQGRTEIVQYTEKIITAFPRTVELGHVQPADLDDTTRNMVDKIVKDAIRALGIDNSASHVELKINGDDVRIIEIGARLGGDYIASYLTTASTGMSMDRAAIQVALGEKPDLAHPEAMYSKISYPVFESGKVISKIHDLTAMIDEQLVFVKAFFKAGDIVPEITDSAKRLACFIVKAETREDLERICMEKEKLLRSKIILED